MTPEQHNTSEKIPKRDPRLELKMLDAIKEPHDLRLHDIAELKSIAEELRAETISAVAVTGGHLGAGLGVVELTVALHYVFDTPTDRLIWDVSHQSYPHKILTGRRDRIRTLRQGGGLSGFTKRAESEYDPFGAAHSSTSISAGLGMAVARDLAGKKNNVIAVIGDGAMSAGMAYEAMNNAGARSERLIVILNDNDMSIAPPVGAMSAYLARLSSGHTYLKLRDVGKQLTRHLPKALDRAITRALEHARTYVPGGTLFEALGYYYVGPIDRRAGQVEGRRAAIHQSIRREPDQGGAQGRQDRRRHRGDAVGHRARSVPEGVPQPLLRCRHCRAARGDLLRLPGGGMLQAVRHHLFDLPAARLRPGGARHRHPAAAGALRHRPRRAGRRRRADPCRCLRCRLSRLPARLRADGGGRRGRTGAHGGNASRHRRPAVGVALSARRGPGRAAAGRRQGAGDRQRPHPARGPQGGAVVLWRAARRMPEGGRRAGGAGSIDHAGRCALCQAARRRPAAAAGARARGAGDHRRRRGRRLRLLCPAGAGRQRRAG